MYERTTFDGGDGPKDVIKVTVQASLDGMVEAAAAAREAGCNVLVMGDFGALHCPFMVAPVVIEGEDDLAPPVVKMGSRLRAAHVLRMMIERMIVDMELDGDELQAEIDAAPAPG